LNLAVTLAVVHWLCHLSLPLDFLGAAQAKLRSETQIELVQCYYFELNSYKVIIIFVIIKPLHPKLAHTFGCRQSL